MTLPRAGAQVAEGAVSVGAPAAPSSPGGHPRAGAPEARHQRRPSTVARRFATHPLAVGSLAVLGLLVALALIGPLFALPPDAIALSARFQPPRPGQWLGTDDLGRDVLSRLLTAGRVSLGVGVSAALLGVLLGTALGSIAGYLRGWPDWLVSRVVDVLLTFPIIALAMAISAFVNLTAELVVLVVGGLSWMPTARLVRAEVRSLAAREFVLAAHAIGASHSRILGRHILPNIVGVLVVSTTLLVPFAILTEAALSFLGFGVRPPTATWGNMLLQAQPVVRDHPELAVYPGGCIALTVACFNFLGDGLRQAIDPRLRT